MGKDGAFPKILPKLMSSTFFSDDLKIPGSNIDAPRYDENGIYYLGHYHPYWKDKRHGMRNPKHDTYSKAILQLKKQEKDSRYFFSNWFADLWPDGILDMSLTCVPSSNRDTTHNGIRGLVQVWYEFENRAFLNYDCHDFTGLLVRHTSIDSAHKGGERSIKVHMDSINLGSIADLVGDEALHLKKHPICIFDDVTTSGNSLLACRKILGGWGYTNIHLCALGKTISCR